MKLDEMPRVRLADLPTALEETPRLAAEIGIERLFVKRDDNTGLALGGNKARKLEFLMADAQSKGAQVVVTCGGAQSNHARQTAAAARKLGMECIIFFTDPMPEDFNGNLLLDALLDAEMRFIPNASYEELLKAMAVEEANLVLKDRTPYVIPVGGSTGVGALGYVAGVREIAEQLRERGAENPDMVMAVGSSGTLAGLILGRSLFLPEARLIGISVSRDSFQARQRAVKIASDAAKLLGVEADFKDDPAVVHDQYVGPGYAIPTQEGKDAILLCARSEGLILDPVYTGKAMAGLIDLARKGEIGRGRPVVFWHTGGSPALFACAELFREEACRLSRNG